jgi:mediator of RNA polymerase II transcription subunit 5
MDEWANFLARALNRRLPADKFEQFAKVLSTKSPLSTSLVAELLLRPSKSQNYDLDPQVLLYAPALLRTDILDLPSTLRGLLRHSTFRPVDATKGGQEVANGSHTRWTKSYCHEEGLMYSLSKIVAAGERPKTSQEALATVQALTEWMRLLAMVGAADDMMQEIGAGNEVHNQETMAVRVAVGALLVAIAENATMNEALTSGCPKGMYLKGYRCS